MADDEGRESADWEWTEYDEGSVMITTLSLTTHISTFQESACDF